MNSLIKFIANYIIVDVCSKVVTCEGGSIGG